jgi:nucleoside 2-deoxyribosyltransferase
MQKVYLASPLGFSESSRGYLATLVAEISRLGYEVFDPWSQPTGDLILQADALQDPNLRLKELKRANETVAAWNELGIRECDVVVAILDGADVDSGTASEVGFAYALGKSILGLRTDLRRSGDNAAALVNLQIQYWVEHSGGTIFTDTAALSRGLTKQ